MIKENLNTTWNIKENSKFIDGKDDATNQGKENCLRDGVIH